jgi:hypothetical protein
MRGARSSRAATAGSGIVAIGSDPGDEASSCILAAESLRTWLTEARLAGGELGIFTSSCPSVLGLLTACASGPALVLFSLSGPGRGAPATDSPSSPTSILECGTDASRTVASGVRAGVGSWSLSGLGESGGRRPSPAGFVLSAFASGSGAMTPLCKQTSSWGSWCSMSSSSIAARNHCQRALLARCSSDAA